MTHFDAIKNIKRCFEKARKHQDLKWITKTYTDETDFYKVLSQKKSGSAIVNIQMNKDIILH